MSNSVEEARNLARMERCWEIAKELGFRSLRSSRGSYRLVHTSDLAELTVTDPEVSWRLSIKERHPAVWRTPGHLSGTYTIETGSVELSNLTEAQFRSTLIGVLTSLGVR